MASELPPHIQNQLAQLQELQRQAQAVSQQRQQLEMSARELDRTIDALAKTSDDAPIYRSVGSLLIRAKDKAALTGDLTDEKETADVRLETMKKQETRLKERLTSLQKELEAALSQR